MRALVEKQNLKDVFAFSAMHDCIQFLLKATEDDYVLNLFAVPT